MSQNNPIYTPPYEKGQSDETRAEVDGEEIALPFLQVQQEAIISANAQVDAEYKSNWNSLYKAMRNEHPETSRYRKRAYRTRSRVFRPKTQSAVRKNLASTSTAMFATENRVQITAEYDDDERSQAQAIFIHELVNYRLTRNGRRNGIPWFETVIGARYDSQITGICCAKIFWESTTRPELQEVETGELDEDGFPLIEEVEVQVRDLDRPRIVLVPPENPIVSSGADWINPAQNSPFLFVPWQMSVDEVLTRMQEENELDPDSNWIPYSEAEIKSMGTVRVNDTADGVKRSRDKTNRQGNDSQQVSGYEMVTVFDCFITYRGVDYHYWSLGVNKYLTVPRPTRESYPAFHGERPYVIGKATIEPHRLYPMSPAESWQPLQQEANNLVNLRIDSLNQVISPITKVKRGKKVDLASVQRRGPGSTIMVHDMDDVSIETPGSFSPAAYTESAHLNADFDELAGVFSQSSVQTSRQMNETVGGMRLMSGSANGLTEFDLRVFAVTFAEPVIRYLTMLEQYYEDDERILRVAGKKALLREKYGIDELTDQFMMQEVHATLDIGIGAADPAMKQAKFATAVDLLTKTASVWGDKYELDAEELILECFGVSGYKNGERFIKGEKPPQQEQPDPAIIQAQMRMKSEQMKDAREGQKLEAEKMADQRRLAVDMLLGLLDAQQQDKSLKLQETKQQVDILGDLVDRLAQARQSQQQPAPAPAPGNGGQQR